jgi:hypothetical protein
MRVLVEFHMPNLADVEVIPNVLERLFGARVQRGFVVPIPNLRGGRLWIWDATGREVDHGHERTPIADAIEREYARTKFRSTQAAAMPPSVRFSDN